MTVLEAMRSRFGDFDEETRVKRTSSSVEGEYSIETLEVSQGPRRPIITITIRKHVST